MYLVLEMYSPCSGTIACCPPRVLPSSPVSNSYLRHLGRWSTPALFPLLDIFRLNAPETPDRSASYVCASQQPSTGVFSLSYDLLRQVIRDPCEHEAAAWHIPALTAEDTHSSPLGGWRSTHVIKRCAAIVLSTRLGRLPSPEFPVPERHGWRPR